MSADATSSSGTRPLKLLALDEEDLGVVSAYLQDAVCKAAGAKWLEDENRFVLTLYRFAWEAGPHGPIFARSYERRLAVLHFERVLKVRSRGIRQGDTEQVLELLALRFEATEAPAGHVYLVFAGGAEIRLEVECLEGSLADTGSAWATRRKPRHDDT